MIVETPDTIDFFRLQAELDLKVKSFIDEDSAMFNVLNTEMQLFKTEPESHPSYAEEWRRFYNDRCSVAHERINPMSLKSAWAEEWEVFLKAIYRRKLNKMREELMTKLLITKDDIEDFLARQRAEASKPVLDAVSPISSVENINPEPPEITSSPSQSTAATAAASAPVAVAALENTKPDCDVVTTLRLLSAIEDLLEDLGVHVIQVKHLLIDMLVL